MITEYLNRNLLPNLSEIRILYTGGDVNSSNYTELTDYDSSTEVTFRDTDLVSFKVINPTKSKYNVVIGISDSDELVFIKESITNLWNAIVGYLTYNIRSIKSDDSISFDLGFEVTYQNHSHKGLEVTPISKFTTYGSELMDDESKFHKGKIISDLGVEFEVSSNLVMLDYPGSLISDMSHLYGVNLKYEALPTEILSIISDSLFKVTDSRCSLTYRGSTICYRRTNGEYVVKLGLSQSVFGFPVTLITERILINSDKVIYQFNGTNWIPTSDSADCIGYRSAYIKVNSKISRII